MFYISLEYSEEILLNLSLYKAPDTEEYDTELHPVIGLLPEISNVFTETGLIKFHIQGFDDKPWLTYVSPDLSIFAEQLPDLIEWSVSGYRETFQLDFYEQTLQRSLLFNKSGNQITVRCQSLNEKHPYPNTEMIELSVLNKMLKDFVATFLYLVKLLCPNIYNHSWFQNWIKLVLRLD